MPIGGRGGQPKLPRWVGMYHVRSAGGSWRKGDRRRVSVGERKPGAPRKASKKGPRVSGGEVCRVNTQPMDCAHHLSQAKWLSWHWGEEERCQGRSDFLGGETEASSETYSKLLLLQCLLPLYFQGLDGPQDKTHSVWMGVSMNLGSSYSPRISLTH